MGMGLSFSSLFPVRWCARYAYIWELWIEEGLVLLKYSFLSGNSKGNEEEWRSLVFWL